MVRMEEALAWAEVGAAEDNAGAREELAARKGYVCVRNVDMEPPTSRECPVLR